MTRRKKSLTFLEAAKAILEEMKQPMHFKKITEMAIQKKYLSSKGRTPEWTMGARLSTDVKEKGKHSEFIRTDNGKYGLSRWKRTSRVVNVPDIKINESDKQYWLLAVEPENFDYDCKKNSFDIIGVKYRMRRTLSRLKIGDRIVVYVKKRAEFGAILEVTGDYFIDDSARWPKLGSELSARLEIKPEIILPEQKRIDARSMYSHLEVFTQYPEKHRTLALRNGITEISERDFNTILKKM